MTGYIDWPEPDQVYGADEVQRHCSICPAETDGAPLCDKCAWQMRRDCKVTRLAITAGACVGSGTIDNLRRDEALLAEYDEYQAREAKLIPLPVGASILWAEICRFEEERGCMLVEMRAERSGFIALCRLAGQLPVRLDAETRPGHVVLVGQR